MTLLQLELIRVRIIAVEKNVTIQIFEVELAISSVIVWWASNWVTALMNSFKITFVREIAIEIL